MGVQGLWEILQPAAEHTSLTALAVREGVKCRPGERVFRLGIDASIWFHQVQQTFATGHANSGENPELRTMYYRLARLLVLPVQAVFVFDGPSRPAFKRGKKVNMAGHWMVHAMQQLVEAFGFHWRLAPGEAEAELAKMNRLGLIDAVLTDDSDTFVFGAPMVIRNYTYLRNEHSTAVFRADTIRQHNDVSLSHGGLILVALLSGGDYDPAGVPGCGIQTAQGLARYGLGDSLCEAATSLSEQEFQNFLPAWRDELRTTLRTDPDCFISRRCDAIARAINDSFPDCNVLHAYHDPITSLFQNGLVCHGEGVLRVARLAALCELYFGWGHTHGILKSFRDHLWAGITTHMLVAAAAAHDGAAGAASGSSSSHLACGALPAVDELSALLDINHLGEDSDSDMSNDEDISFSSVQVKPKMLSQAVMSALHHL